MTMNILNVDQLPDTLGRFLLIYSDTGIGKTVSSLIGMPNNTLIVCCEDREIKISINVAKTIRPDLKVRVSYYTCAEDLLELLSSDESFFAEYNGVLFDGLTNLMRLKMARELSMDAYNSRTSKDGKVDKPLQEMTKMSREAYGALGSVMLRVFEQLGRISRTGKMVVVTCLTEQHPKWDLSLTAAPALAGQMFGDAFPGMVDYIGLLKSQFDISGQIAYPPTVYFEPSEGLQSFMCKWTGLKPKSGVAVGPYDLSRIFKTQKGE